MAAMSLYSVVIIKSTTVKLANEVKKPLTSFRTMPDFANVRQCFFRKQGRKGFETSLGAVRSKNSKFFAYNEQEVAGIFVPLQKKN